MKRRIDHLWCKTGSRSGAAALELAMLLPFLMLMFSAAVDFARIFNATQIVERAANTGAMYASGTLWVPLSQTSPANAAVNAACSEGASLSPPMTANNVSVTINPTNVVVTVTYDYPLLTAILIPSATVQVQRTVTMQLAPTPGN
jgi:Flp pilus assembly protein TadG